MTSKMKLQTKSVLTSIKTTKFSGVLAQTKTSFHSLWAVLNGINLCEDDKKHIKRFEILLDEFLTMGIDQIKERFSEEQVAVKFKELDEYKRKLSHYTSLGAFENREFSSKSNEFNIENKYVAIILDIDQKSIDGIFNAQKLKDVFAGLDEVFCVYKSTSSRGVRIPLIIESKHIKNEDGTYNAQSLVEVVAYRWANDVLKAHFAVELAQNEGKPETMKLKIDTLPMHQLFAVPVDKDIVLKPELTVFDLDYYMDLYDLKTVESRVAYKALLGGKEVKEMQSQKSAKIRKNPFNDLSSYPNLYDEKQRTEHIDSIIDNMTSSGDYKVNRHFFQKMAAAFNQVGLQPKLALNEVLENYSFIKDAVNFDRQRGYVDFFKDNGSKFAENISYCFNPTAKTTSIVKNIDSLEDALKVLGSSGIIIAPTGAGKTTAVAKLDMKKILVLPNQALLEQAANKLEMYAKTGQKVGRFYEKCKDFADAHSIVTTYSSFEALKKALFLDYSQYTVFVDEYHNLATSSSESFMRRENAKLVKILLNTENYYLLSATYVPVYAEAIHNLSKYVFTREINTPKTLQKVVYKRKDNMISSVLNGVLKAKKEGVIQMLFLENKTAELNTYLELLEKNGLKVVYVNADNKKDQTYIEISQNSTLDENVDVIITTSLLKEGISIENHVDKRVVIHVAEPLGQISSVEIEQLSNRFRNAAAIDAFIYQSDAPREQKNKVTAAVFATRESKRWKELVKIIQTQANVATSLELALDGRCMAFLDETAYTYEFCECSLSYFVHKHETSLESNDFTYFLEKMNGLGWNYAGEVQELVKAEFVQDSKATKKEKEAEYQEKINTYTMQVCEAFEKEGVIKQFATDLSMAEVKAIENKVSYFSTAIVTPNLGEFIINNAQNKSSFGRTKFTVDVQRALVTKGFGNENVVKFFKSILGMFEIEQQYTITDILQMIKPKIKILKSSINASDEKVLKLFRALFNYKSSQKWFGKTRKNVYEVISTKPFIDVEYKPITLNGIECILDEIKD